MTGYANPFAMFVIADLLGVPESDHQEIPHGTLPPEREAGESAARSPKCRRTPWRGSMTASAATSKTAATGQRDDVLTALATTRFPER